MVLFTLASASSLSLAQCGVERSPVECDELVSWDGLAGLYTLDSTKYDTMECELEYGVDGLESDLYEVKSSW